MKDRMAEAQRKREKTERNNEKKEQRLRYPFWPLLARGVDYKCQLGVARDSKETRVAR